MSSARRQGEAEDEIAATTSALSAARRDRHELLAVHHVDWTATRTRPEPVLNFQSCSPVFASKAKK